MHRSVGNTAVLSAAMSLALAAGTAQAQAAQGDPLYRYQWHLMNYGQSVLGDTKPTFAVDLGIDDLHDYNIRGKGVTVGVLDEGVEIGHPDLAANVVANGSKNFDPGAPEHDPTPTTAGNNHGTAVAGIIAAVGWNGIGVRGVAPAARLKSFNGFGDVDTAMTEDKIRYAWWDGAEAQDQDVSSNSWSSAGINEPRAYSEMQVEAYERPMSATRGGRGTVYVKSAGNYFQTRSRDGSRVTCAQAVRDSNVGCVQTGMDRRHNLFNVIVVAAVNAAGKRSSYSSAGSSVWVSGLGGEYGRQAAYSPGLSAVNYDPAIVTTDLSGCARGNNVDGSTANALDSSASAIDNTCNYYARMNGTSAAAPTVSGVAALMLQANPKLSYRDVKYILATTARQVDPDQPAAVHANGTVMAPGWVANAAGRRFSNWYGFGLVDATLAVQTATRFKSLPALIDSGWQRVAADAPAAIGGAAAPARLQIALDRDIRKIEGVQVGWSTDYSHTSSTTPFPLRVTLISPSRTRSTLMPAGGSMNSAAFGLDFFSSNAFLDEPARGDWTLEIVDVPLAAGAAAKGRLSSFKIRVLGH